MTFIELMLALAGTAAVGLGIVSMLVAVSYGTNSNKDMLKVVVQQKTTSARIDSAVRTSKMVLETGFDSGDNTDYLVLWTADTRANEKPNLSELRMIEFDRDTGEITAYASTFADGLSEPDLATLDLEYELADDFRVALETAASGANFVGVRWATGLSSATFATNDADAQAATIVSYRMVYTTPTFEDEAIGAAALRNITP